MLKFSSFTVLIALAAAPQARGAGGTRFVAWKGRPAHVSAFWPTGVESLLDDPVRTDGWNPWFSGYPNDVSHFAFEIASMDDLNRIIAKLAACKCKVRRIQLSYETEPASLGFVSGLPKGNKIACLFSIGDQAIIDQFYAAANRPIPIATPPTLTIYVQNDIVNLEDMEIPDSITVSAGSIVSTRKPLDATSRSTAADIDEFIKSHRADADARAPPREQ
jgi:hypothetical protein